MEQPYADYYDTTLCYSPPAAFASLHGSPDYPDIHGTVFFFELPGALLIQASVRGLPCTSPKSPSLPCASHFFGFHLHTGRSCSGTERQPFSMADGHFNPEDCPHPAHAGDFPPLLGNDGIAWSAFLTDRLKLSDILGRVLILHESADDFTSQPSGNAGAMIACGVVQEMPKSNTPPQAAGHQT